MRRIDCFGLLLAVVVIGGCGYGKQAQIDSFVAAEKNNLPKVLFGGVKVVDMESAESKIIYFCDAKGVNAAGAEKAKDEMLKNAEKYVKNNQEGLQRIIDARIKMTFVARNKADEVFRFTLNPWELK